MHLSTCFLVKCETDHQGAHHLLMKGDIRLNYKCLHREFVFKHFYPIMEFSITIIGIVHKQQTVLFIYF